MPVPGRTGNELHAWVVMRNRRKITRAGKSMKGKSTNQLRVPSVPGTVLAVLVKMRFSNEAGVKANVSPRTVYRTEN